jgi:uncharacterized membrane protein YfcA
MNEVLAALIALAGGLAGGLVGVGGGVLFVPALAIFIGLSQVAAVGAYRQYGHGNLKIRDALLIGVLSPVGVVIGVVASNAVSQRVLELCFAALALFVAYTLVRRALTAEEDSQPSRESESPL